jgi:predicted DNA-binding protein (MmcQ/YjbR family)
MEKLAAKLRKLALTYPETYEEAPWGDRVVKVKGKIFLFCGARDGKLQLSVKLPSSGREVLREKWATPTPYGLGKSGWVSAEIDKKDGIAEARLAAFIDESYRAVAPKKLLSQLGAKAANKAPAKKQLRHRVMLLCEDELRADRARHALGEAGVTVEVVADAAAVRRRLKRLDAAILDLGRSPGVGLALAEEIDASDHPIHLFVAGIRDARADKRVAAGATSAERFRAPPGDAEVVSAIAATLATHKPR